MTQETWNSNATLSGRIAFLRGLWGYKKVQMAEVLSISGPYLSEIESGKKSNLSGTLLKLMSSTFFVSVNWIITGYVSRELRNQLETARLNKSLSVRDVAYNLAVPEEFICHIEYGNIDPSETLLEKLCTLYGIALPVGKTGTSLQSQKVVSGDLEPSDSFLSKLRTHYGISENADNHACGSSVTLKTIGEKIRHLRRIFGLSQVELAKSIGVKTAVAISKYESNLRVPDASKLCKIAKTFNVTLDWLLNNEAEDVEAFKTDIDTPIAKRLRLIREKYNISQRTAALRTGELQQNWARYETGTKIPHTFLYALRKTFFIDLNWFITGETPSVIEQAPINTQLKQLEECFASDISPQPESGKTGIPERPFLDPVNNVKKGRKSWVNAIVKLFSRKSVTEDI